jgi:methionyl-tRNA synthetase
MDPSKLGAGGYAGLLDALPRGMPISVPPELFSKIEDAQVAEWTQKFGGGESS